MSNIKISEMTEATTLGNSDLLTVVQSGANKKITKTNMVNSFSDKLVNIGTTAPVNGERVWFYKSKNLISYSNLSNSNTTNSFSSDTLTVSTSSGTYANAYRDITELYKMNAGKTLRFDFGTITSQVTPNIRVVGLRVVAGSTSNITLVDNNYNILTHEIPADTSSVTGVTVTFYANNTNTATTNTITITNPMLHFGADEMSYEAYVKPAIIVDGVKIYEMS